MKQDKWEFKGGEKKTRQEEALTELVREAQEMGAYDNPGKTHYEGDDCPGGHSDQKEAAIQRLIEMMGDAIFDAPNTMKAAEACARIAIEQGVEPMLLELRRKLYEATQEDCEILARTGEKPTPVELVVIENAQNRLENDTYLPWDAVCAGEKKEPELESPDAWDNS